MTDFDSVVAREFVLVDAEGRHRAALEMFNDGPHFIMWDAQGQMQFECRLDGEGHAGLALGNISAKPRILISEHPDGTGLAIWDADGNKRCRIAVTSSGEISVDFGVAP
jgi:hypothetical protein